MAADVAHVMIGFPYLAATIVYALLLTAVFILWRAQERDLSVHAVTNTRREVLYWAAVLATFALGTALGDFTAVALGIGYLPSIAQFAGLILIPAIGYRALG